MKVNARVFVSLIVSVSLGGPGGGRPPLRDNFADWSPL